MPITDNKSIADRFLGSRDNVYARLDGSLILKPDDLLEGKGDLIVIDENGNPEGWRLGKTVVPNGWNAYVGGAPDQTYRQNAAPLARNRPTFAVNQAINTGQPAPTPGTPLLAPIPRPLTPRVIITQSDTVGYPASTPESPYWFAWSYATISGWNFESLSHSLLSRPTPFQMAFGDSARVPLPDNVPEGIYFVGLWLSEPGLSRPEEPGPMRLQRVIDLRHYFLASYDLTGPYRYLRYAPAYDETKLTKPGSPTVWHANTYRPCRMGTWMVRITFSNELGESIYSDYGWVHVPRSETWTSRDDDGQIEVDAGQGEVVIDRRTAPPGATGWRAYVTIKEGDPGWARCYNRYLNLGDEKPFPISQSRIKTSGWSGSGEGESKYGIGDTVVLVNSKLPIENETGLEPPDSAPGDVFVIGSGRPGPGLYYVRVTDDVDGVESLPSDPVSVLLGENDIMNIIPVDPNNEFMNGDLVEIDANGLPMYWDIDDTGGDVYMEEGTLVMETSAPTTGATPTVETRPVEVDPNEPYAIAVHIALEDPHGSTISGYVEIVLREYDDFGNITETVIGTMTRTGGRDYNIAVTPYESTTKTSVATRMQPTSAGGLKSGKARISKKAKRRKRRRARRRNRRTESRPGDFSTSTTSSGSGSFG